MVTIKIIHVCIYLIMISSLANARVRDRQGPCSSRQPSKEFQNDDLIGSPYLIAENESFPIQFKERLCGIGDVIYLGNNIWQFDVSYQEKNGTLGYSEYLFENKSPPGSFDVYKNPGDQIVKFVILGGEYNKFRVATSCNTKSGAEAIWIFYKRRVNGLRNIDQETKTKIYKILFANNIRTDQLNMVDNRNCLN